MVIQLLTVFLQQKLARNLQQYTHDDIDCNIQTIKKCQTLNQNINRDSFITISPSICANRSL